MKKILSFVTAVSVVSMLISSPVAYAAQNQAPDFANGSLSGKLTKDINGVYKYFNDNKAQFGVDSAENEFTKLSSNDDFLGFTHIKTQQMVNGIPVYGSEYIIHFNKDGQVYAANGKYNPSAKKAKVDKSKLITPAKASLIALSKFNFDSLEMTPTAKLYLYNVNNEYVPVYEVRVNFLSPAPGDWHVFVNAVDGTIVNQYNTISSAAVTLTGTGVLGDTKTLNGTSATVTTKNKGQTTTTTQYQLVDNTRPAAITTYTANNGTSLPGSVVYSLTTFINDKAAVDAHAYAGMVYDFYKVKFNRNGLDNKNMTMKSTVHYSRSYNNAFWNGTQMVYGDGDGVTFIPLSGALDVVGHEMTHAVDSNSANLIYQNQSGALNESFSDVFGTLIEFDKQPTKADWLVGEDVYTPNKAGDGLRDMSNPAATGDPDNMSKYVNTTSDNGGVHTNSGIPNKAFYLTASNANVGNDKAAQIYYRALTTYLTSSATFHDARVALVQAATDLYGASSAEVNAVNTAWSTVGVN